MLKNLKENKVQKGNVTKKAKLSLGNTQIGGVLICGFNPASVKKNKTKTKIFPVTRQKFRPRAPQYEAMMPIYEYSMK